MITEMVLLWHHPQYDGVKSSKYEWKIRKCFQDLLVYRSPKKRINQDWTETDLPAGVQRAATAIKVIAFGRFQDVYITGQKTVTHQGIAFTVHWDGNILSLLKALANREVLFRDKWILQCKKGLGSDIENGRGVAQVWSGWSVEILPRMAAKEEVRKYCGKYLNNFKFTLSWSNLVYSTRGFQFGCFTPQAPGCECSVPEWGFYL